MDAFPLHQRLYKDVKDKDKNLRSLLYHEWASWNKWYKYQPIESIRDYFGEQIAFYFAWLGFYTSWLLIATVFGVAVFLYGVIYSLNLPVVQQICNMNDTLLCPSCEECPLMPLNKTCSEAHWSFMFDHSGSVIFAIFMSIWAVAFLEFWKRQTAHLSYRWSMDDYEEEDAYPRPEYCAKATTTRRNPITKQKEPYFSKKKQKTRMCVSMVTLLVLIFVVLIFVASCIIYRSLVNATITHIGQTHVNNSIVFSNFSIDSKWKPYLQKNARMLSSGSAAVLNLSGLLR